MLLIHCPICQMDRPELEFRHAGQAHLVRPVDPRDCDDVAWGAYLYLRDNTKGVHAERWRHIHGCGRFFNTLRHTVTDRLISTYLGSTP